MALEVLAIVKHDCPACDQILPPLDAAGARVVSQSAAAETAAQARRLKLSRVPEIDEELRLSERFDPDAVPTVVLLDDGVEVDRVEGLARDRIAELVARTGSTFAVDGLPAWRPGCASKARDPEIAAHIAARRARRDRRLVARELQIGGLEDPAHALYERGMTDGLPVVPPTPERVVAMLAHTSRHPQDLVGIVPPYSRRATVEKVAINAVMSGCAGPELPIVLAALEAASRDAFSLQGVVATTAPTGPIVVVSGPYASEIGMNAMGNVLGQGNRANMTVGRALQLTIRNVGGGVPQREDRATHGGPLKLGMAFPDRLDETSPWPGLAHSQLPDLRPQETGVTVFAGDGPSFIVDERVRDADSLATALAVELAHAAASRRDRLTWAAMLVLGGEYGAIVKNAGWSRQRLQQELYERSRAPSRKQGQHVGRNWSGLAPAPVDDPDLRAASFAGPDRILLAYAGGDAGLFAMLFGGWVSGPTGSIAQTGSIEPWR